MPIEYSREEQEAVAGLIVPPPSAQPGLRAREPPSAAKPLSLIDQIPTEKDSVFNYDIHWEVYKQGNISALVGKWLSKKTVELLGEEEKSLVEFICSKLNVSARSKPCWSDCAFEFLTDLMLRVCVFRNK